MKEPIPETLDEIWEVQLSMWEWIKDQVEAKTLKPVYVLKSQWLEENNYDMENIVRNYCFFCHYAFSNKSTTFISMCEYCPAALVEPEFDCYSDTHDFNLEPVAFYYKLKELNTKRKASK